jgi:hypothetical protein
MDKEEQKIEQLLKSRIESIKPPKAVFEHVTNTFSNRNTKEKSNYQLINFFMTKGQYAGLALAVIAIIVVVSVSKTPSRQVAMNNNYAISQSQTQVNNDKGFDPKSQSADVIMASFYADADADGANANAESEEDAYMNSQVDAFTSFNQTNYENNI